MQAHSLLPHPGHPALGVTSVVAKIDTAHAHWITVRWRIKGSAMLVAPKPAGSTRADALWQDTCFELFIRPVGGEAYREFNLSPSERWNVYDFDAHRTGMRRIEADRSPICTMRPGKTFAIFDAAVPKIILPQTESDLGISAVIEEDGGRKSFWALGHSGAAPDFHDPACFAARLDPRPSP